MTVEEFKALQRGEVVSRGDHCNGDYAEYAVLGRMGNEVLLVPIETITFEEKSIDGAEKGLKEWDACGWLARGVLDGDKEEPRR